MKSLGTARMMLRACQDCNAALRFFRRPICAFKPETTFTTVLLGEAGAAVDEAGGRTMVQCRTHVPHLRTIWISEVADVMRKCTEHQVWFEPTPLREAY